MKRDRFFSYSESKLQDALLGYTETVIENILNTLNKEDCEIIENLDDGQYESLLTHAYFKASPEVLNLYKKLVKEYLVEYVSKLKRRTD